MSLLDADDLYELARVTELATSPSGDRVAFVVHEFDPDADERRRSLFVAPTDEPGDAHRLTRASNAGSPAWSRDGSKLAFIAAREADTELRVGPPTDAEDDTGGEDDADAGDDEEAETEAGGDGEDGEAGADDAENGENGGDDEPKPQVWVFDLERGGDARQVTEREEGVGEFDWSPDGERLVVAARDPTEAERERLERRRDDGPIEVERLQHKADGVGWLDAVTTYLFVVDVESRETTRLDEAYGSGASEPANGLQPAWGPDDRIAFLSNRTERPDDSAAYHVYAVAPDGENLDRLTDGDVFCTAPTWSPDGSKLAMVVRDPPTNWYKPAEVHVLDVASGRRASVSAGLDRTVALQSSPSWTDEETLVVPVGDEGRTRLVRCHADGAPAERVFEAQGSDRTITGSDATTGGVAVALSAPDAPPDVHVLDDDLEEALEEATRVTALNESFVGRYDLPSVERLTFENGDGDSVEALLFLPAGADPTQPELHPVVVDVHGGPMAYDTPGFAFKRAFWTARGYVVLCVNFRGSSSYGRTFCEALRGSRGRLETDDITSGVDALVERGWADPDRLFLTGVSYGGIATAHLVARTDRFAAAAPEHGIYDHYSAYGTDDNHLWTADEFGLPWENVETYRDVSSITRVGEMDTPLLVTAGEQDWRCPPTQAEQLYVSVRKRGVPAKLVVYQDEHHAVDAPERAIHRLETLHGWFRNHDPAVDGD